MSATTVEEIEQTDFTQDDAVAPEVTPEVSPATPAAPNKLEEAMADLAGKMSQLAAPKKDDEPELSEADRNKLWAVYNPEEKRPDFMKKFFRMNPEATPEEIAEVKELWADMQQGLVRQSVVGARNITMSEIQKLREEFAPLQEHVQQQRNEATRNRFYDEFPALSEPNFSKVITATASALSASGKQFPTEKEFFKALAESAAETIKAVLPTFDLGAKPANKPAVTSPRLPRTSVGGTGGSGNGGGAAAKGKSDDDFDSLDFDKA